MLTMRTGGSLRVLAAGLVAVAGLALSGAAPAHAAVPLAWRIELSPTAAPQAVPPLPPVETYPVQLVLDDDTAEGTVGVSGPGGARNFLWFSSFLQPGGPFDLAEMWVLFPVDPNIVAGDAIELVVYLDADGDPTNGAELLASVPETVQVADGNTFSTYLLPAPVEVRDPGELYLGVVSRFFGAGDPPTATAAVDTTVSQGRSWVAVWSGEPPSPPALPADLLVALIGDIAPAADGNWMIRGFGTAPSALEIPTIGGLGLLALALLLGVAALLRLRTRASRRSGTLALALVPFALLALGLEPAASATVIDEFSTPQGPVTDPPGGGSTAVTGGADILGGKRGVRVRTLGGPGPTSAEVTGGALDVAVADTTPDSHGEVDVIWDGDADNDPSTFDPTGFGTPVDLTAGGHGGFRITVEEAQAGTHLLLTVYEDANQVSRAGRVLPAIGSTTEVFIAFRELVAAPGAVGPADLTQVGALLLRIGARESASPPVVSISHIETVGPTVTAAKVDRTAAGGAIPPGGVDPGDSLRYRVTVQSTGGGAEDVDFDDLVADPNLGAAGSIRTTPLARRDQYATISNTVLATAGLLPSLLDNDTDADGNTLVAVAVTGQATLQGGSVDVDADGDFVYTPPPGFVGSDAFTYTLQAPAGDPTVDAAGNPVGPFVAVAHVVVDRVPPVIVAGGTLLYAEGDGALAVDAALTVTDADSANLTGATATITGNYVMGEDFLGFVNTANISGVFTPATGELALTGTDTVAAYQAALQSVTYENTSDAPSELDRTVTWTATDGVETSLPATSIIEVTAVNDPPVVNTSAGVTAFTENGGAVVVDGGAGGVSVSDVDDADLESATVTITNLLDAGAETLAANTGGTSIVASYTAPTLTLTGSDTLANYQLVLRTVTYDNTDDAPDTTDRIVRFVANDGTDPSAPADKTVSVTAANDAPVLTTSGGTASFTEDGTAAIVDPGVTVTDADDTNLESATVTITNVLDGTAESLGATVCGALTVTPGAPGTGTLSITGSATLAVYQTCLRSVAYQNTDQDPDTTARSISFVVNDGDDDSNTASRSVTVTAVNDAPVVTTTGGTADFIEDQPAVAVDPGLTVTDVDDTSLVSATVTITNLLDAGLETLAANTGGTSITALYAAPTLTLTGPDTVANFQQVMRSVTYNNTSQNPNLTDRVVRFVAHDGTDPSAPADKTVTVTPQNDPPVAGDDFWQTIGNTQLVVDLPALATPHVRDTTPGAADGVRDNDADPVENDNHMVTGVVGCADPASPFDCPTANGGTVSLDAAGTFTYTPAAGDAAASDSFQYILTDDGFPAPANDIGTVTIQRFERVWYVRNNAAPGGDGTSGSPLDALTALNGAGGAGDLDGPDDYIFIHLGDGSSNGQSQLVLENGQHLLGQHAGLSIPVDLNGNGPPTVLHAATPGPYPQIHSPAPGIPAVSASQALPAEIAGLILTSTSSDSVDVTTTAAFAGSGTLSIRDLLMAAGANGIDVNHGGTGALSLGLQQNTTLTIGGRGINVARTGSGSLTITRFNGNTVRVTGGSAIEVSSAIFDATPGLPIQSVSGGLTVIGQAGGGVAQHGLVLNGVSGHLTFTDLDIISDGGAGLRATSTGTFDAVTGAGFRLVLSPGVATIDANGGPAVDVTNASVTLPLAFLESTNSTTTGLSLVNAFGGVGQSALSVSSGQISDPGGASGDAVVLTGGNGNITIGVPITNSSGRAVVISSRTSDTVSFTGSITDTGAGILVNSNSAGTTTSFRGGMSLSTGSSAAFTATNGGTLEICDENPCNPGATGLLVNTLTTTTGTALNVTNTTIGANKLELRNITSTGAGGNTAIILANTGAGAVVVSGSGGAGTGGTISNKTVDAMTMSSTGGLVTLRNMIFQDIGDMGGAIDTISGDDAIDGQNVNGGLTLDGVTIRRISDQAIHGEPSPNTATVWNGLTITNSTIENTNRFHVADRGDANNEGMVRILGIRGTVSITDSVLQDGGELIDFFVTGGTLDMTATGSDFLRAYKEFTSGVLSSVGNHCIDVTVQGAGNANVTLGDRASAALGNEFLNCRIGSVRVVMDVGATGSVDAVIANNDFTVDDHTSTLGGDFFFPMGGVLLASLNSTDSISFDGVVANNYFDEVMNASGGVGQFSLAMHNGNWQILVEDNTFDTPGNAPWWVRADSTTSARVRFQDNVGIKGAFCSPDPSANGGGCNLGAGQLCPGAAGYCGPGIRTLADLQNGAVVDLTIVNDTFAEHDAGFDPGQTYEGRILNTGGGGMLCLDLQNNRAPDGYSVEEFAGDFNLIGSGSCPVGSPSPGCQTVLGNRGNLGGGNVATTSPPFVNVEIGSTIDVVAGACLQPTGAIF